MRKEGKVTVATSVPYYIREFIEEKAKEENKRISVYLREFFIHFYQIEKALDKLEEEKNSLKK